MTPAKKSPPFLIFTRNLPHMIDAFAQYLLHSELIPQNGKVLVACSGGPDSMVLAELLHRLGYTVSLAHVNYRLRGADSDADEALVTAFAAERGLACFIDRPELKTAGIGKQAAARKARYTFFERLIAEHGADCIATAHHRDDLVESYLAHILRGSHWKGFIGIARRNGQVVRPLLHLRKDELLQFAAAEGIPYRIDASNASSDYTRNRIRHELIPLMRSIRPGFENNILRQIENFIEVKGILSSFLDKLGTDILHLRPEGLHIHLEGLEGLPFLRLLMLQVTGPYGFHAHRVEEVLGLIDAEPGKLLLSDTHRIIRERDYLVISPRPAEIPDEIAFIDRFTDEVVVPIHLVAEFVSGDAIVFGMDEDEAVMDVEALEFPLIVRRWEAGDRIRPIGLDGSVKVSDLLTQAKLDRHAREKVCVVVSGDDIVWVPGFRMAEAVKVTPATTEALRLRTIADEV